MGMFVWLFGKPLFYVLAFTLLARHLAAHRPHALFQGRPVPTWLVVGLAAVARIALGVPGGSLAVYVAGDRRSLLLFAAMVIPLGALLWFLCAHVAFRKAPRGTLVGFAFLAECVTGAIDTWAFDDLRSVSFC